eukprot:jgi/Orpsp1_1/1191367/evm.model.d7180000085196.1
MLELYRSKLLQKGLTQNLVQGNSLLLNRTSHSILQKRLKSNILNIKNDAKLDLASPFNNASIKRELSSVVQDNGIGSKNNEMWKDYRAIDPRVIRPLDGTEFFVLCCYINVTDVFPKISTEEFKKRAEENLSKIKLFNLALKRINGHLFFINKPFKMHLKEVEYNENEEIENYLKFKDKSIIPYEPIQEKDDEGVQSLFHFKICQLKKSNQTKITVSINHVISDGRTIFNIMDYIRKIVNGETLERNDELLTNFGGMDRFKDLDESFYSSPKIWDEITNRPLIPKVKPPFKYIRPHMIFDYEPIKKFIKENDITIQAMLMAVASRAARRYNNLPKETPIWNTTQVDIRASPLVVDEFKKRKLYDNVGVMYVKMIGQSSLMEDLKHCMAQLQEAKKSNDGIRQLVCCSSVIDKKTLKFIPKGGFPNQYTHSIVNSSNIGLVNGDTPLITSSNDPNFFTFNLSSYHTKDKLFVTLLRPYDFDQTYVDIVKEEINKVFIPENISKY